MTCREILLISCTVVILVNFYIVVYIFSPRLAGEFKADFFSCFFDAANGLLR